MYSAEDFHAASARRLIKLDPARLTEDATGLSYTENLDAFLALTEIIGERQRAHLSELCDTYSSMPWQSFGEIVDGSGFETVYTGVHRQYYTTRMEQFLIAADRSRKLVLFAESYTNSDGAQLGGGYVEGTISDVLVGGLPIINAYDVLSRTPGIRWHPIGSNGYAFTIDIRDGLQLQLHDLETSGVAFTDWESPDYPHAFYEMPDGQNVAYAIPAWVREFSKR